MLENAILDLAEAVRTLAECVRNAAQAPQAAVPVLPENRTTPETTAAPQDTYGELDDFLVQLDLTVRAWNCAKCNNHTVAQLLNTTGRQAIKNWQNCGAFTVAELAACLDVEGIPHKFNADWTPACERRYPKARQQCEYWKKRNAAIQEQSATDPESLTAPK